MPTLELKFARRLLRIQSERRELTAPFWWSIAKSLDTYAAGQAAFDRRADEVRSEECKRERDGHVDLTHAAFLTGRDLFDIGHCSGDDLAKPAAASRDGVDKTCATLDPGRTYPTSGTPCGTIICRDPPDGGFCQETENE